MRGDNDIGSEKRNRNSIALRGDAWYRKDGFPEGPDSMAGHGPCDSAWGANYGDNWGGPDTDPQGGNLGAYRPDGDGPL